MRLPSVIAVDGPAASGKSIVAARLAERLGYVYFDTGALYRAVTWLILKKGIDPSNGEAAATIARTAKITITRPTEADGRQYTVTAEGEDITWQVVSAEVDAAVSTVSAHPEVRQALLARQRATAAQGGVVMAGRDIGTVVAPDADLKIYLEASPEVRAQRRCQQVAVRGQSADYHQILADLRRRDGLDSQREAAPLRAAPDAVVINTDVLTLDQELAIIEGLLHREQPCSTG